MDEPVLVSDNGAGTLTVTLNRPHRRNALSPAAWTALRDALLSARHDESVRVVVLTGADGAFCSGQDISDANNRHPVDRFRLINDVMMLLHQLPTPTIARVTGDAVGAGWNLALACDFVVATPTARFAQIFTRRGLSTDTGGSWLLPRIVGPQQAKRIALLAEFVSAQEAHQLGLVGWVIEPDAIDTFVADLANRLASGPRVALALTKELLNEAASQTFEQTLVAEMRAQVANLGTDDTVQAYRAFRERRSPSFTGEWAGPRLTDEP